MAARGPVPLQQPQQLVGVLQQPGMPPQQQQQQQQQVYALPPLTQEQLYVQKRQAEEIQKDVRHLTQLDTNTPFQNVQDAVVRLLPFHVSSHCVSVLTLLLQQQLGGRQLAHQSHTADFRSRNVSWGIL